MSQPVEADHSAIRYPVSDGQPLAETEIHVEELLALRDTLKDFFRHDEDVYVGANMFVYYEEGNRSAVFAPDVFVARGVRKAVRRTYKLWEEGRAPSFVMEMSSDSTWLEDTGNKKALCARLEVAEYFLFDPLGDYLEPRLQGFRLKGRDYERIAPDARGAVESETLGLRLAADGTKLRCANASTGELLLRSEEAREELREAAQARRVADEARRAEEAARRAAEEARRVEEAARRAAEAARRAAEEARREAERRTARAEAEARSLRERLAALEKPPSRD